MASNSVDFYLSPDNTLLSMSDHHDQSHHHHHHQQHQQSQSPHQQYHHQQPPSTTWTNGTTNLSLVHQGFQQQQPDQSQQHHNSHHRETNAVIRSVDLNGVDTNNCGYHQAGDQHSTTTTTNNSNNNENKNGFRSNVHLNGSNNSNNNSSNNINTNPATPASVTQILSTPPSDSSSPLSNHDRESPSLILNGNGSDRKPSLPEYLLEDGPVNVNSNTNTNNVSEPMPKKLHTNGKKTKGRVKIKMEFIDNKLRRYTTFSKRKSGIMKKAYELSTLTGTQVMLLVASETGHVYTFATKKLKPMITSDTGKALIKTCLFSPEPQTSSYDPRMSSTGYEETELSYSVNDDSSEKDDGDSFSSQDLISPSHPHGAPNNSPKDLRNQQPPQQQRLSSPAINGSPDHDHHRVDLSSTSSPYQALQQRNHQPSHQSQHQPHQPSALALTSINLSQSVNSSSSSSSSASSPSSSSSSSSPSPGLISFLPTSINPNISTPVTVNSPSTPTTNSTANPVTLINNQHHQEITNSLSPLPSNLPLKLTTAGNHSTPLNPMHRSFGLTNNHFSGNNTGTTFTAAILGGILPSSAILNGSSNYQESHGSTGTINPTTFYRLPDFAATSLSGTRLSSKMTSPLFNSGSVVLCTNQTSNNNGLMYQTPQGVVYATTGNANSMFPESLILNFGQNLSQTTSAAVANNSTGGNNNMVQTNNNGTNGRRAQNDTVPIRNNHQSNPSHTKPQKNNYKKSRKMG